jgi:hypothetical protein
MITNTEFVNSIYNNMLLRSPAQSEASYLVSRLDSGLLTRQALVEAAIPYPEVQATPTMIAQIYQTVFNKVGTTEQLTFWANIFRAGASYDQIAQQMASSSEVAKLYPNLTTQESIINLIYQNALNRNANTQEIDSWKNNLQTGQSYGSIIANVAASTEAYIHNINIIQKTLLWHAIVGNEPTASNLSALPNDASALAVAIMKQPTLPQLSNAFWESSGTLYGSVDLTGNVVLDLTKNTLTMGAVSQTLTQGSLPSAINADLSALNLPVSTTATTTTTKIPTAISQKITFTGDDAANNYVGSNYGDVITTGKGNDTVTLGTGVDSIYFADSNISNGIDTINQFTLGTDQLIFGSFLNKTTASVSMLSINAAQKLQQSWANGDVLVIQGNSLTSGAAIANLFGTAIANPIGASKAVLITADITGNANIWYLVNQTDITHITANEITQVGVLTGVNNLLDQHTLASLLASTQVNVLTSVNYDSTSLQESASNNGSISNTITVSITGDLFTGALGASLGKVSNVPAGLTAKLIKTSDTTASLTLTGKATANNFVDSIDNLTVTFTSKDFTSANLPMNSVTDTISVNFVDLNINETGSMLSVIGAVPNNLVIDLSADTISSGTNNINILSGSLSNATKVDLSGIVGTTTSNITVNGSSSLEGFIASPAGETFRGAGAGDAYLLGAGIDNIIFEPTAAANGKDLINGFKLGTGGDILNFSSFLNVTGKTHITTQNSNSTAAMTWSNADVLVVQGDSIDSAAKIAALFGPGYVYAAPTGQAKAVVISSDLVGDATVWYVTNQSNTGITTIDSTEVSQVAVLQGINNMSLIGLTTGNLA